MRIKKPEIYRGVVTKIFMIDGEIAEPGDIVELSKSEYGSLKYNEKIRDLTADELAAVESTEQVEGQPEVVSCQAGTSYADSDKKGKK
ncbi:hypothetical protein QNN88_01830 [Citrobacter sp. ANG330]|uniref:hypothetical protein n=1 Tax=Citrobacter sp. ANG330 TaxID=3048142 RepID=UPI0039C3F3DA